MINKAHESTSKAMQEPAVEEAMKRKAGLVRDPRSSTPTPEPEED